VASSDEQEGRSEERESMSEGVSEDVEAHGITDRPIESPVDARNDEGDDVEAHTMSEAPPSE